jgi:glycosyltransferase involved in cell wall biosynthesis
VRILHVDPERGWGGGEVQVLALLRALAARGHQSTLAADPDGRLAPAAAALGVPVRPLRIANHLDALAGLRLRRLVPGHDVVHFHTARAHALAPFCRGRGARLVVTRRMDYVPAGGPWMRWLYNGAVDAVIAISEGVRAALLRGGVRPERVCVVPSGVDLERLAAPSDARERVRGGWEAGADAVVVLVPGALERRKGHAVLLDAAARLAAGGDGLPPLRYVFCGDGTERAALVRAAAPLGGAVRFAGFRDDMGACLAAADVVALPSLNEGLGVAALEGAAAARPVVASRVGGLVEAVADGETGVLVAPGDAAALAAALRRLAADAALRARLGAAGRARVVARYSVARMAEGTLACYGGPPCA